MNTHGLNLMIMAQSSGAAKEIIGLVVGLALVIAFGVAAWSVAIGVLTREKDPEGAGQKFITAAIAAVAFGFLVAIWNIAGLGDAISTPSFDF